MGKHAGSEQIIPEHILGPIRQRASLARLAGIDAEDAGKGWDEAKNRVMRRSAQDVAELLYQIDKASKGAPHV